MTEHFNIVVIGGGPGGYVAAIRGAQLGFKVALIEKRNELGGTCLNVGCIPSKALLDSTEHYYQLKHKSAVHGIKATNVAPDLKRMMDRKNEVVQTSVSGIDFLIKKNKITRFKGIGSFVDPHLIRVVHHENVSEVSADNIVIATGSEPAALPFAPFDGERILSSTEALELKKIPRHLIVIGGGFIGLEIGSVYGRLGSRVTVIEFLDSIIPTLDRELGKTLERSLKKLNIDFYLQTRVTGIEVMKRKVDVIAEDKSSKLLNFSGDYVLVAIGRRPYTKDLNLDHIGINLDNKGRVEINSDFQTSCERVYAIGDVTTGPMLAHKAEEEGVAVVEIIAGEKPVVNHRTIPGVVYTWPEVASVGKSEEQLKQESIDYKKGTFPFKASGRARAADESEGFIKVLADAKSDEILGVHMIGPRCSDMIAEAVVAMEYRASAEDIGRIVHAHPTFTESFKEAALMAAANRAIHL